MKRISLDGLTLVCNDDDELLALPITATAK